jgi:two-component system cell cycle sensor histidine kinase/response regulator CckA
MVGKPYNPKPGNYVLIRIRDTGVGMDQKTMERIFDPFFTTKGLGTGTGLGLASVYGIIKAHRGYIDVESREGEGSTFDLYLPGSEIKGKDIPEGAGHIVIGNETILLVDDEPMILQVGCAVLQKLGYTVFKAEGGREALEVYKEKGDSIDLVILDMLMPDMGGSETYDRLKDINPTVKVLLSSGYSVDGQATEILNRGCDAFIQKPFSIRELSGRIREILRKKQLESCCT